MKFQGYLALDVIKHELNKLHQQPIFQLSSVKIYLFSLLVNSFLWQRVMMYLHGWCIKCMKWPLEKNAKIFC